MVEAELRLRPRRPEQQRHTAVRAALRWGVLAALVGLTLGLPAGASAFIAEEEQEAPDTQPSAPPLATTPAPAPAPAPAPTPPPAQPRTTPPPSTTASPSTAQQSTTGPTESALDEDETTDDGVGRHNRRRFFYLEASAGYSWVKLGLIRENNLVPDVERLNDTGYAIEGGAGFFVSFITLGIQAEVAMHSNFNLGTVLLDLGIRLPTKHLEPYFRFGIGYAWLFNSNLIPGVNETIRGVAANLGIGFDYMVSPLFAIGVGGDATLFNVRRSGVNGVPAITDIDISEEGDAIGLQISALVQLSLHF
jgi:hypothetical protein